MPYMVGGGGAKRAGRGRRRCGLKCGGSYPTMQSSCGGKQFRNLKGNRNSRDHHVDDGRKVGE